MHAPELSNFGCEEDVTGPRSGGYGLGSGPAGPDVKRLVLAPALRARIIAAARRAFPQECCGLLLGRVEGDKAVATGIQPSPNCAPDPRTGFEIDIALLFAARRAAREKGEAVLGHYHSHPRGPAAPSETDRARAWVPGHVWLIVGPGTEEQGGRVTAQLAVEEAGRIVLRALELVARDSAV